MAYRDFLASPKGRLIDDVLRGGLARMERFSHEGRPALLAVDSDIARVAPQLTDTEKQHVGRRVHQWIGPRGWRPAAKKRLPKGSLFTTAAVYELATPQLPDRAPDAAATPLPGGLAARMATARDLLRQSPSGRPFSVDEFIAERREEARRERKREQRWFGDDRPR